MRLKSLLLLMVPLVCDMLTSCCNCENTGTYTARIQNRTLSLLDNSGSDAVPSQSDTLPAAAFGIRVSIAVDVQKTSACKTNFQFSTAANAIYCDCTNDITYLDSLDGFRIKTLTDFDASHPAGSYIDEYFAMFTGQTFIPLENSAHNDFYYLKFSFKPESKNLDFDLLLMQPPAASSQQQFEVEMYSESGLQYTMTSSSVYLQN